MGLWNASATPTCIFNDGLAGWVLTYQRCVRPQAKSLREGRMTVAGVELEGLSVAGLETCIILPRWCVLQPLQGLWRGGQEEDMPTSSSRV